MCLAGCNQGFPRAPGVRLGADSTLCRAGLCGGLRLCRRARLRQPLADLAARAGPAAGGAARDPFPARRRPDPGLHALSLRLPAGLRRLRGPCRAAQRGGENPRRLAEAGVFHRRPAAGAPGDCRRFGAGAHGSRSRFRRGQLLRRADAHQWHLPNLVRPGRASGRHAIGRLAVPGRPWRWWCWSNWHGAGCAPTQCRGTCRRPARG